MRETKDINLEGRIQFDLLQYFLREHRLRSYSLNSVSSKFLGEQKEEVRADQIADLFLGNEFTRRRLAIYCIKDCYLPIKIIEKLECIYSMSEISRVCGIPM
jgi:DNA polymerase delta subunit 1